MLIPSRQDLRHQRTMEILAPGKLVTADFLAAALGCSVRTVYRDIDRLRSGGTRIDAEPGVGFMRRGEA